MNAFLLFKNRILTESSLDTRIREDLEMSAVIESMAGTDSYIRETAVMVMARENMCRDSREILYRQSVLEDCIRHESEIRQLYDHVSLLVSKDQDTFLSVTHKKAKFMLDVSVKVMLSIQEPLTRLHRYASELGPLCRSEALSTLCDGLILLFEPAHLSDMAALMKDLSTKEGITSAAVMGKYLRPPQYHPFRMTDRPSGSSKGLFKFLQRDRDCLEFDVDMSDPDASPALSRLRDSMTANAARIVVQARDELFEFLKELKRELSFYIGCLNLRAALTALNIPLCIPELADPGQAGCKPDTDTLSPSFLSCRMLCNVSLGLIEHVAPVVNSIECRPRKMVLITGSNQGGKTTFLRSLGQALLMGMCGMFVAASSFRAVTGQVFTHFLREEDQSLQSGKLDEELSRMKEIVTKIRPGDWLLLNESFASTNEEEGSEIALEIITALSDQGVGIVYVTHFYHLVQLLQAHRSDSVLYLNAVRDSSGNRTFRLEVGEPVVRGYGEDLFHEIFSCH